MIGRRARMVVGIVDLTVGPAAVSAAAACLSPAELERAERGTDEVRARRVLVRAALRELLGDLLATPAREVPLAARPGRPALDQRAGRSDLDLSCSASGDVGLVAVVRGGHIGVDVQRIGYDDLDAAVPEGWLSVEEVNRIDSLPAAARPAALTRAWVQKEAVLKGQGTGLRADLAAVRSLATESGWIGRWSVSGVDVPASYVACAAVRATGFPGRLARPRTGLI
jgi:4'-phosphopantetheinyl transferase